MLGFHFSLVPFRDLGVSFQQSAAFAPFPSDGKPKKHNILSGDPT
jgi:hypothetical protein